MNIVVLSGRLTKDVDLRYSQDQKAFGRFALAVKRRKKDDGADFVNCVAFDKNAETIAKYSKKGDPLNISGRIRTGSYTDKDGRKVYTTEVYVDNFEFASTKKEEKQEDDGFIPSHDPDLPF